MTDWQDISTAHRLEKRKRITPLVELLRRQERALRFQDRMPSPPEISNDDG